MKIALLGYGKMGKAIEQIALQRGHTLVLKKDADTSFEGLQNADVAIDFSLPSVALDNLTQCFQNNIPVVCGTTGWLDQYPKAVELCNQNNGAFIYGSNFSLGVNLFFELNQHLARLMSNFPSYKVSLTEIHHTQKLDAPSGTAISLAKDIISNHSLYNNWQLNQGSENDIVITAERVENVPGTHSVYYTSAVDTLEIKHTAHNREGFALGAVIAAEWLQHKKGIYTLKDVLGL